MTPLVAVERGELLAYLIGVGTFWLLVGIEIGFRLGRRIGSDKAVVPERIVDRVLVLPVVAGSVTDADEPLTTVVNMPKQARH